jgi:hypothetical protein
MFDINKMIKDIIKKERKIYREHIATVAKCREEWSSFSVKAKDIFQKIIDEFEKDQFFDNLYIDEGVFPFTERKNQDTISLRFGSHPTGISKTEYYPDGKLKSAEAAAERGGALHYSQSPNGQVVCIIYGSKSELIKPKDEYFVFKRYNNPNKINEKELIKATKVFLWYTRITSFITRFSIWDTYKLDFYKIRSFTTNLDWNTIFGVIGAAAAIISIISFFL